MKISFKLSQWLIYFIILFLLIFPGCSSSPTPETNDPIIQSFYAEPSSISSGENSTLHWQVSDATNISIDHGIGAVALSGSTSVSPTITTTYALTATNTSGSVNATTTVTVDEQEEEVSYGMIEVDSNPEGAKIYLDGVDTGQITPAILLNIASGSHTIKLTLYGTGYMNWEDVISLDAGQVLTLDITMIGAETEVLEIVLSDSNGKDAGVEKANEGTNYGNLHFFAVGNSSAPNTARAYLKFDLNELPSGAYIYEAQLKLYMFDYWGSGSTYIWVHQVTESWQENQITWINQPNYSSSGLWSEHTINSFSDLNSFFTIDVGSYLSGDWKNQNFYKYGFVLIDDNESSGIFAPLFYSSEYVDANKKPKLIIFYYIP